MQVQVGRGAGWVDLVGNAAGASLSSGEWLYPLVVLRHGPAAGCKGRASVTDVTFTADDSAIGGPSNTAFQSSPLFSFEQVHVNAYGHHSLDISGRGLDQVHVIKDETQFKADQSLSILLPELFDLNLRHNRITRLPASLALCDKLQTLDMSFNNLSGEVPACIGNLAALQVLCLHGNSLTWMHPNMSNLNSLKVIDLANNPWGFHCDKGEFDFHRKPFVGSQPGDAVPVLVACLWASHSASSALGLLEFDAGLPMPDPNKEEATAANEPEEVRGFSFVMLFLHSSPPSPLPFQMNCKLLHHPCPFNTHDSHTHT